MKRKQIIIPADLEYQVERYAQKSEQSFSAVVREALVEYIHLGETKRNNQKKKRDGFSVFLDMAKNATNKGPSDLSTNDNYLYGSESEKGR